MPSLTYQTMELMCEFYLTSVGWVLRIAANGLHVRFRLQRLVQGSQAVSID